MNIYIEIRGTTPDPPAQRSPVRRRRKRGAWRSFKDGMWAGLTYTPYYWRNGTRYRGAEDDYLEYKLMTDGEL